MPSNKSLTNRFSVAPDVWRIKDIMVNMFIVRDPKTEQWVLIDAGLITSKSKIKQLAADLFGPKSRPIAILLTHGHFDHVGSLKSLAEEWNVPIYAHSMEFPYLNGCSSYPPPDPSVGGGLMARLSWLYPKRPLDVSTWLQKFPEDGSVPFLSEWKTIETPGHSPGHVSFFRDKDRLLIAGDAVVTTKQESALAVMLQKKILSGPPQYFTCDWEKAKQSVKRLADLKPLLIATGHGQSFEGQDVAHALEELSQHFNEWAVPSQGRYVNHPAVTDTNGVVSVPPQDRGTLIPILSLLASFLIAIALFFWLLD